MRLPRGLPSESEFVCCNTLQHNCSTPSHTLSSHLREENGQARLPCGLPSSQKSLRLSQKSPTQSLNSLIHSQKRPTYSTPKKKYSEISPTCHLRGKDGQVRLPRGLPLSQKSPTLSQKSRYTVSKEPQLFSKETYIEKEPLHILKSVICISIYIVSFFFSSLCCYIFRNQPSISPERETWASEAAPRPTIEKRVRALQHTATHLQHTHIPSHTPSIHLRGEEGRERLHRGLPFANEFVRCNTLQHNCSTLPHSLSSHLRGKDRRARLPRGLPSGSEFVRHHRQLTPAHPSATSKSTTLFKESCHI